MKFEASPIWFLSEGTNGYCGVPECCYWYPKETEEVVFCSPKRTLLTWYPQGADEDCSESENRDITGVELIKGSAGETTNVCLALGKPEDEFGVTYVTAPAKLSDSCGGGCCIFELIIPDN